MKFDVFKNGTNLLIPLIHYKKFLRLDSFLNSIRLLSNTHTTSISKLQTMQLPESQLKQVLRPNVVKLADLFSKHGFEVRIAGGAVRDILMGLNPKDLDFATTATPDEMKAMFEAEEVRMINKNGELHGTITARIDDENLECTTLRIDSKTDGRHAEVKFIRDWQLDAGRRDLTVNALYLGLDGTIYDYFDGISHLKNNKVMFVGNPEERIKEDYLRILRYFRFYGVIASHPDEHDESTLDIIRRNVSGLEKISGERIWVEVAKIVTRRFGGSLISKMIEVGIGPTIGLPKDFDIENVSDFYARLQKNDIDTSNIGAVTYLSGGFSTIRDADHFIQRVKCSNKEKDVIYFVVNHKESIRNLDLKNLQHLMSDLVYKEQRSRANAIFAVSQLVLFSGRKDLISFVKVDNIPIFPIKGGMLKDKVKKRYLISQEMKRLYVIWKDSDYSLTTEELLSLMD